MGAVPTFLADLAAGLVAGISAAAPWFVYSSQIVSRLASANARPPAYVVAALPAIGTTIATLARVRGVTTGSFEADVTLIAAFIGLACSWAPIARFALAITGGPRDAEDEGTRDRVVVSRVVATVMTVLIIYQTVMAFAWTSFVSMLTCFEVDSILAEAEPGPPNPVPLRDALPYPPPEDGALSVGDLPQNMDQAASSRHDPEARAQLAAAGFTGGHVRYWYAADGRGIQANVFEFGTPEGAAAYQAQVNRHACRFSNDAFEAPMGGVGLQVRYATENPIQEQVSWVAGNRRYLVSVTELAPPSNHRRILAIADAAMAIWPVAADPSPQPSSGPTPRPVTDPEVIERALDDVRDGLETTLAEGTVWIDKRSVFTGSSEFPEGSVAYAGGQMSLGEAQKMRMMVQFAGIEDTERNSAQIIIDGSQALVNGRLFDGYAGEGRWLLVDLSSSDPRTQPFRALASGPNDASFALFTLYGATRILSVADDVMDGLPVRRYTVNIQLDAALDQLPEAFVDGYESNLVELGRAQIEPQYTAEVWISQASGLIHHIEYVQELGPNMGEGSMSTTVDLIDFGVPLDLDYPEPELITRLEDIRTPIDPLPKA